MSRGLASPCDMFRASMAEKSRRTKRALAKSPVERAPADHALLYDYTSDNPYFAKLTRDLHHRLSEVMSYEKVPPLTTLFQQGDEGDFFYIIHSGQVELLFRDQTTGVGVTTALLGLGDSFGDASLLFQRSRGLTCISRDHAELFKLDKDTFLRLLGAQRMRDIEGQRTLLSHVLLLDTVPRNALNFMAEVLISRRFASHKVVFTEGSEAESVYFVRSGELRVLKTVRRPGEHSRLLELYVYRAGDMFGDDDVALNRKRSYSVAANVASDLLLMSATEFIHLVGDATIETIRKLPPRFPDESRMLDHLAQASQWTQFKHKVAEETVAEVSAASELSKFLRNRN
eukprot:TRINITY_DN3247_c0_g3_i1.p1 TRINITY_DN3247_c0_g3~~TRINITY_DN3247_c0_g3_i1.p1  ORF type:complete len:343 (-),score=43.93 TRINITY_DN3247_c0_g3_i1:402-1430(-)